MPDSILVNGEAIGEAEIRAQIADIRQELESRGAELGLEQRMRLRNLAVSQLTERLLLHQECRRLKFLPTEAEVAELAATLAPRVDGVVGCRAGTDATVVSREAERRLMLERIISHWSRNLRPPKSTEVRDFYRSHPEQFHRPETVHASHLVRNFEGRDRESVLQEMESARHRLLEGRAFATLAATCSDCPENGGDLGFFARGVMVEEFDDVVFAAPLHQVTPVFETRFGAHVAVVHEHLPEGLMELNEVGGRIAEALYRGKQDQEVGRQLEALRRKAVIQVMP